MKSLIITVILVGGLIACLLLFSLYSCALSFQDHVRTFANPNSVPIAGLPANAINIEWLERGALNPNEYYAFDISESDFEGWVKQHSWPGLTGPHYGPYMMYLYDHSTKSFTMRQIANAIAYTWSEEDSGVYMVYDVDAGRAYYHAHSR